MGIVLSLGLMGVGLVGAILGAAAYRSRQKLAGVMLIGVAVLLTGAISLLITLW